MVERTTVLLLGSSGALGRAVGKRLAQSGFRVVGVDRTRPDSSSFVDDFIKADVDDADSACSISEATIDIVILALPASSSEAALTNVVLPYYRDALLVDLLSEKEWFAELVNDVAPDVSHLGIHPLFAPSVDWKGQSVLFSHKASLSNDAQVLKLRQFFLAQETEIEHVNPSEHDRVMGAIQVAPHALLATYAMYLVDEDVDFALLDRVSTPAVRVFWAMLARVIDNGPEVYWEIQKKNRNSELVRNNIVGAVERLQRLCESDCTVPFSGAFDKLAKRMDERLPKYTRLARDIYEHRLDASETGEGA